MDSLGAWSARRRFVEYFPLNSGNTRWLSSTAASAGDFASFTMGRHFARSTGSQSSRFSLTLA